TGTEPYCCMDFTQATIEPAAPNPNGVTTEFLRASEATVKDYQGKLVTVPADTPRFQGARWDGSQWHATTPEGAPIRGITYLNEPASTNLLDNQDISTWGDVTTSPTVVLSSELSPLGTQDAYLITFPTLSSAKRYFVGPSTIGNKTCVSGYVKEVDTNKIKLRGFGLGDGLEFDLQTGESTTGASSWTDSGMEPVGNGWWRLWAVGAIATKTMYCFETNEEAPSSLVVWGLQVEDNVDYPTSYIPTAGASVTREADDLRYIGGPTAEISIQIGFESGAAIPNSNDFRLFGSKSSDNNEIRAAGANNWNFGISAGGFYQNMNDIAAGKRVFSGGYENGNQKVYLDGGQRNVQAVVWSPSHSNQYIQLGRWKDQPTTIPLRFSTFKLWNSALPDDELKALSGQDWNCPED
ncbi:MAG: hypothetical protein ACK2UO_17420, partial [Caldilineaceae bacterium]